MKVTLPTLGPSSIFLNYGVFASSMDYSWLKPFVLLFDSIILEDRYTLTFAPFVYREPELYSWFEDHAIILEDYGLIGRKERNHRAIDVLRPLVVTNKLRYNKTFLKSFSAKMRSRAGGPSDRSGTFDFKMEVGNWTDLDALTDSIVIDELVDAEVSVFLSSTHSVPSVLDDLQTWLYSRAVGRSIPLIRAREPVRILRLLVPNLNSLDWKTLLELRDSEHRSAALLALQSLGERPTTESMEQVTKTMWRLVTEAMSESSVGKAILRGVAGNIPFLPINPLGLAVAVNDIETVIRRRESYGWLFFLAQIRDACESRGHE